MAFDSHQEASKLDHLAKDRLDTKNGLDANIALAREWGNLSPSERNVTAKALNQDFNNHKWNGLPKPEIHLDADGNCNFIDFKASHLDFHQGPKHVTLSNDHEIAIWVSAD
jgi:hypothetical protein